MGLCKFCNKWLAQPEGKRKKEFCNNTCRSNFWYGKNKKGKSNMPIQDLTKPNIEIKPFEQPKSNYAVNAPPIERFRMGDYEGYKRRLNECHIIAEIESLHNEVKSDPALAAWQKIAFEKLAKEKSKEMYND